MYLRDGTSDYYMWLLDRIDVLRGTWENHLLLAQQLYSTEYTYTLVMDSNRASAGVALRSQFAAEEGFYLEDVQHGPCSVLEMLIALADSMAFDLGCQTSKWFWEMMSNLGVVDMDDDRFDSEYLDYILQSWMDRAYDRDGQYNIFYIKNYDGDMAQMDVWSQMNAYITNTYPVGNWMN